jgi:hypothetical protein
MLVDSAGLDPRRESLVGRVQRPCRAALSNETLTLLRSARADIAQATARRGGQWDQDHWGVGEEGDGRTDRRCGRSPLSMGTPRLRPAADGPPARPRRGARPRTRPQEHDRRHSGVDGQDEEMGAGVSAAREPVDGGDPEQPVARQVHPVPRPPGQVPHDQRRALHRDQDPQARRQGPWREERSSGRRQRSRRTGWSRHRA